MNNDRAKLVGIIMAANSHFYVPDEDEAVIAARIRTWLNILAPWPVSVVEKAFELYLTEHSTRAVPKDIVEICRRMTGTEPRGGSADEPERSLEDQWRLDQAKRLMAQFWYGDSADERAALLEEWVAAFRGWANPNIADAVSHWIVNKPNRPTIGAFNAVMKSRTSIVNASLPPPPPPPPAPPQPESTPEEREAEERLRAEEMARRHAIVAETNAWLKRVTMSARYNMGRDPDDRDDPTSQAQSRTDREVGAGHSDNSDDGGEGDER